MRLTTVDAHVAGAAVRLVTSGVPTLAGPTLRERQRSFEQRADRVRTALCREPRGHSGVIGVVLTEPDRPSADAGLLFFHGRGYPSLHGEAVLAASHLAIRHGLISLPADRAAVHFDTPAGPVVVRRGAGTDGHRFRRLTGPAAFVLRGGATLEPAPRTLRIDIVWSGSEFLVIADAELAGAPLVPARAFDLQRIGVALLATVNEHLCPTHPTDAGQQGARGAVFIGAPISESADVRSAVVHEDGALERAPSASATAAVVTVLHAMGMAEPGRVVRHEGLIGTSLQAAVAQVSTVGAIPSCEVEIEGDAFETGQHTFIVDPEDPLADGVLLG